MFVEDTYSSEEIVDQQPVLVKVMDTADQVMIYIIISSILLELFIQVFFNCFLSIQICSEP